MKTLLYSLILTTLLFFNKIDANTDLIREAVGILTEKKKTKKETYIEILMKL